jgi:CMP/dCMP kinase
MVKPARNLVQSNQRLERERGSSLFRFAIVHACTWSRARLEPGAFGFGPVYSDAKVLHLMTQPPTPFVITIDGLAASGKSSVARRVALALGVPYVSSGLLYRAITVAALEAALDLDDETAILGHLSSSQIRLEPLAQGNRVWLGDREITDAAHSTQVDATVSRVARHPNVRAWVNSEIRKLPVPFVAEGRDMGAVVFRDTPAKVFLTASPRVRAERRTLERPEDLEAVETALRTRDALDAANSEAAPDAFTLDTSTLTLEQVVAGVLERVRRVAQPVA